jgi:hypothetical protein
MRLELWQCALTVNRRRQSACAAKQELWKKKGLKSSLHVRNLPV